MFQYIVLVSSKAMKIKFYFLHHIESKFYYLTGDQKEPSKKGLSKRDQAKRDQK